MSIRTLEPLFNPNGIAVVGGSDHPGTVGRTVIDNLVAGGFGKPIHAVNLRQIRHPDANWVAEVEQLPPNIDLAVICTPPRTIPDLVGRLGRHGVKILLALTGGVTAENGLKAKTLAALRETGVRMFGPNSVGLHFPHAHLNASFGRGQAAPGDLALIAQSGAVATGLLDWAGHFGVGFSGLVSCGDAIDVDMADLIDLFAGDDNTRAILLHLEGIKDARRFLSAARAASRRKPVIALKAGRSDAAAKAALTHTGALAGSFDIHTAAFRRAGIVMVDTLTELFAAAEILAMRQPLEGERLAIVTNGGGAAVLALDTLAEVGGKAADLHADTIKTLNAALPSGWSHANPVDLLGDADAERYQAAIAAVDSDPAVDALLVMNCPIGMTDAAGLSEQVSRMLGMVQKPAIGCWLGGANFDQASADFADARVPLFNMPEDAVRAFGHLRQARRAAEVSRTAMPQRVPNGRGAARAIIDAARADGRTMLSEPEAQRLLAAYGVDVVPSRVVARAAEVAEACTQLQPPYAVKIISPAGLHKSDVGGVALDLATGEAAAAAAERIATRLAQDHPKVVLAGFIVETMVKRVQGFELVAGIANDPIFGPVIMVGAGGKAVEVLRDRALGLPPLDSGFAREMIDATRIAKLLHGYRDQPPAAIDAITQVLCTLSAIAIDLPDLLELDINPLLVDPSGAVALDARIRLGAAADRSPIAICPIPSGWSADLVTRAGDAIHVRPASPADLELITELFHATACEDLRFRFGTGREVPEARIRELIDVDYAREITFLALGSNGAAVAAATINGTPDGDEAAITLTVREDCKGRGVSWTLMEHALRYAKAQGIRTVNAVQNVDDERALQLEREMGFAGAGAGSEEDDLKLSKAIS